MAWGPHNSFQDAYQAASSLIRQTEPIKTEVVAALSSDVSSNVLERIRMRCRANANDLANIRTLVAGVMDYAKTQHPAGYDIEAKWLSAEATYKEIADEIDAIYKASYSTQETARAKAAAEKLPDIKALRG